MDKIKDIYTLEEKEAVFAAIKDGLKYSATGILSKRQLAKEAGVFRRKLQGIIDLLVDWQYISEIRAVPRKSSRFVILEEYDGYCEPYGFPSDREYMMECLGIRMIPEEDEEYDKM